MTVPPTLGDALRQASLRLAGAGSPSPRLEAELLLTAATGLDRGACYAHSERPLTDDQGTRFEDLIRRRCAGIPIAHLLGSREFWGLDLAVTQATLIPRPETETLVEWALATLPADAPLAVADLGTGTGAIAAALAHERARWTLIAVDRYAATIAVAAANARRLGLSNLLPVQGHWLSALAPIRLDAILSNPPYIPAADPHLDRGDLRHEPRAALAAGADGLAALRAIIHAAPHHLRPNGWLALEHGWDQGPAVRALLARAGLRDIRTIRDAAGHARMTVARLAVRLCGRPSA